jgi:2'-phosphotransferase
LDHIPLSLTNLSILSSGDAVVTDGEPRLPDGVEILHGTSKDAWEKIRASGGLSRMKRNHIHLAKGRPDSDSVISGAYLVSSRLKICSSSTYTGMRKSSAVIIHIDLIAALKDQITFFVASNGAVLTSGKGDSGVLPLDYISKVEDSKTGAVLWQPGQIE